jgi:hypothetical protein
MNTPLHTNHGACLRISLGDIDRSALEDDGGRKSFPVAIVPRKGLPAGATHAVYQIVKGKTGEEHPVVGHAKFYSTAAIQRAGIQLSLE